MTKLSVETLGIAMPIAFASPDCHPAKGSKWQQIYRYAEATIKLIVANQKGGYPNYIMNDRDWDALLDAERHGRGDHFMVVLAKVSDAGKLTYVDHIDIAEARRRLPSVRHFGEDGSGFRLLPPDFCSPAFGDAEAF